MAFLEKFSDWSSYPGQEKDYLRNWYSQRNTDHLNTRSPPNPGKDLKRKMVTMHIFFVNKELQLKMLYLTKSHGQIRKWCSGLVVFRVWKTIRNTMSENRSRYIDSIRDIKRREIFVWLRWKEFWDLIPQNQEGKAKRKNKSGKAEEIIFHRMKIVRYKTTILKFKKHGKKPAGLTS